MSTTTPTSHPNESVIPVTPSSPGSSLKTPNIKRHAQLYRYGKTGLLGKKGWKESNVIIYDDSTFKIFKDAEGHKTSIKPIKLEDVVLDLAFGKAAAKYGPPSIVGDEHNFIAPNNFIAIPETKERNKIHWFCAKDEIGLNEIMHVIAETVAGKIRPPQMGKGAKGRYFNQDENEKWVTYWHSQQHQSEFQDDAHNGEQRGVSIANPIAATPVAIPVAPPSTSPKSGKPTSPKAEKKNKKQVSPAIVVVEMPKRLDSLRVEHDGLIEEDYDMVPHIRLVNGKRIKENVVVRKPQNQNQSNQQPEAQTQKSPKSILINSTTHRPSPAESGYSASPSSGYSTSPAPTPSAYSPASTKIAYSPASTQSAYSPASSNLTHSPTPSKLTYAPTPTPPRSTATPTPPKASPNPTPIIIKTSPKPSHYDYNNGNGISSYTKTHNSTTYSDPQSTGAPYKTEISTYLTGDPEMTTMNIAIAPVKESFSQQQEREEVVTDKQKTIINVGTSERIISKVDNSDNGVTYSTTKHSSFHRSTVTTTTD